MPFSQRSLAWSKKSGAWVCRAVLSPAPFCDTVAAIVGYVADDGLILFYASDFVAMCCKMITSNLPKNKQHHPLP